MISDSKNAFHLILPQEHSEFCSIKHWRRAQYGLDKRNEVYYASRGKRCVGVLKIYRGVALVRVRQIAWLMNYFHSRSKLVPAALETGKLLDGRFYIWMKYAPGMHRKKHTPNQINQVAHHMAKVHATSSAVLRKKITHKETLVPNLPWREADKYLLKLRSELLRLQKRVSGRVYDKGIIHGDYSGGNCLFLGSRLNAVLDWDHSRYDSFIIDIARAQIFFCFDINDQFQSVKLKKFLEGYEKVRPLKAQERKDMMLHVQIQIIRMLAETYYYTNILRAVNKNNFVGAQAEILPHRLEKKLQSLMRYIRYSQ